MKVKNIEIFQLHADFCKTLANPKRLIIVTSLKDKELTVSDFSNLLEMPVSSVSQHLKSLRDQNIVTGRKDGHKVYYSLKDPRLIDACDLIRSIISDLYKEKGKIVSLDYGIGDESDKY